MSRINKTIHRVVSAKTGKLVIAGITVNGKTVARSNPQFDIIHRETQHNGNMNADTAQRLSLIGQKTV